MGGAGPGEWGLQWRQRCLQRGVALIPPYPVCCLRLGSPRSCSFLFVAIQCGNLKFPLGPDSLVFLSSVEVMLVRTLLGRERGKGITSGLDFGVFIFNEQLFFWFFPYG